MYTYTDEYKKGQFFTPEELAAKMIAAVPDDLWGKPVLEPCCGDGNLVIALLDNMVERGISPDEAVSLVQANELDEEIARACEERVKKWMVEHRCSKQSFTVTTYDAVTHKFNDYVWVFTNPPYGSFIRGFSNIMNRIVKNTCTNKPSVLLVKRVLKLDDVISVEDVKFPGINVKTIIAATYPGQGKRWDWVNELSDIIDEHCEWECSRDEANYAALYRSSSRQLLRIMKRSDTSANKFFPLKLTDEEYERIIQNIDNTEREQAYMEAKDPLKSRYKGILRHAINQRLGRTDLIFKSL